MRIPYRGSGTVLVCNNKILLGRRSTKPFKNYWSIPGGGFEKAKDLTDLDTAVRETKEETGIDLNSCNKKGPVGQWKLKLPFFSWTAFYYVLEEELQTKPSEFYELRWVEFDTKRNLTGLKGMKMPFLKREIKICKFYLLNS